MSDNNALSTEKQLEIWETHKHLVKFLAYKYMRKNGNTGGNRLFDFEDLLQAGFLAVYDTAMLFDPERGSFSTLLYLKIKDYFSEVSGTLYGKKRPEVYAVSLDEPYTDENWDGNSLIDSIADTTAEFEDRIIELESILQDYRAITDEIDKLPDDQRKALYLIVIRGLQEKQAAKIMRLTISQVRKKKMKAIDALRRSDAGQSLAEQYTSNNDHTREMEKAVLWLKSVRSNENA